MDGGDGGGGWQRFQSGVSWMLVLSSCIPRALIISFLYLVVLALMCVCVFT